MSEVTRIELPVQNPEEQYHLDILLKSLDIFIDRTKTRGHLWRTRPPSHKLEMIREKLDRAEAAYTQMATMDESHPVWDAMVKEYEDSLLDINNFSVFAIRQVREGQRG